MFRRLTNANKNGQSHEQLIELQSCDVMHDWVPRWREHYSREYLYIHLCPFPCHNIMLPLPRNALERSSAQTLGLITVYFPWIKSSGIICQDSIEIVLSNSRFIDMVRTEHFMIQWRKRLEFVSNEFDSNMKHFWVHVSSSCIFVVVVVFSNCILTKYQEVALRRRRSSWLGWWRSGLLPQ